MLRLLILHCIIMSSMAFELTILHTNDVHARVEEFDKYNGECSTEENANGECFGGVARRATKVNEIRNTVDNVLFLDAGDQFQGTMWFYFYKGTATSHFMNLLGYDAMAIGNHEFDNTPDGLAPFLKDVDFPVLSSNMNVSQEPILHGLTNKSIILTIGGENIGIIGYTYSDTELISRTRDVTFVDEVTAIQEQVDKLRNMQVNKIIAVGHSGISVDLKIAREVNGLDVVVGGHTDTFLYTGTPPSTEVPYRKYPIVVHPDANPESNVLVVQDYTFGKYLGELHVTFDENGDVKEWNGNPILLNDSVAQDPIVLAEVNIWGESVNNLSRAYVGRTNVMLEGNRKFCRRVECNMGNLVTDAFVHMNVREPDELKWSSVSMAMWNGGGIRQSIAVGDITVGAVIDVLPFGNTVDIVQLKGEHLLGAFEHSVHNYDSENIGGEFLQTSGIRVTYDLTRPIGQRVAQIELRCSNCTIPQYFPLDKDEIYTVIMNNFIADGGDGYDVIKYNKITQVSGNSESSMFAEYISLYSPITTGLDNHIRFSSENPCIGNDGVTVSSIHLASLFFCLLLTFINKL